MTDQGQKRAAQVQRRRKSRPTRDKAKQAVANAAWDARRRFLNAAPMPVLDPRLMHGGIAP